MPTTTVLFDLDGTLTDSYRGIANSVAHALAELGLPPVAEATLRTFVGPPLHDSFARLGLDARQGDEALCHYRDYFSERGIYENQVYEGVPTALAELRERGLLLAIATSKPRLFAVRILEHFDLDQYFAHVAGATLDGSTSRKSDAIAEALAALGAHDTSTVVMVGDRAQDVTGAAEHGIRCLGVRWGYAEHRELEAAGAYAIAETPADLPALLP